MLFFGCIAKPLRRLSETVHKLLWAAASTSLGTCQHCQTRMKTGDIQAVRLSEFKNCSVYVSQVANVVKNLDVFIDNSVSPSIHCKEASSKARRMLFMIWPSFAELSVSAFAALYSTLVRSHFEYAIQACSSGWRRGS